jgi:hypothetical protein
MPVTVSSGTRRDLHNFNHVHEERCAIRGISPVSPVEVLGTTYLSFSSGSRYTLIFLSSVAGVAIRMESRSAFVESDILCTSVAVDCSWHMEKAQKFSVLTGIVCNSHGCGRVVVVSSAGKTVENVVSSEARSCHILKLLSRPWLRQIISTCSAGAWYHFKMYGVSAGRDKDSENVKSRIILT